MWLPSRFFLKHNGVLILMQRRKLSRRLAQILWWIGLAMVVVGTSLAILRFRLPGYLLLGGGLAALGLNALIGGELIAGPEPRPFTVRGPVVRGHLEARTGLCDLTVGLCSTDRIAAVQYGPLGKPGFEVRDGVAYLRLVGTPYQPNVTRWQADLAGNVLWDVEARSFLGDLTLNLSGLRLESVTAKTALGRLDVTCPTRGYTRMSLKTTLGDIELHIPTEIGAKVSVKRGALATIAIHNERVQTLKRDRYATPDFEAAPVQVEIQIETAAGDIILS